jgi:cytochrome c oxidase assembly factor CtaG
VRKRGCTAILNGVLNRQRKSPDLRRGFAIYAAFRILGCICVRLMYSRTIASNAFRSAAMALTRLWMSATFAGLL